MTCRLPNTSDFAYCYQYRTKFKFSEHRFSLHRMLSVLCVRKNLHGRPLQHRMKNSKFRRIEDFRDLANQCTKFFLNHTVDLFKELDIRGEVADPADEDSYGRVCRYMIRSLFSSVSYLRSATWLSLSFDCNIH